MDDEVVLEKKLDVLRDKHREIDALIDNLAETPYHDQLRLMRLKKQRLDLRERIIQIEAVLYPDIIA